MSKRNSAECTLPSCLCPERSNTRSLARRLCRQTLFGRGCTRQPDALPIASTTRLRGHPGTAMAQCADKRAWTRARCIAPTTRTSACASRPYPARRKLVVRPRCARDGSLAHPLRPRGVPVRAETAYPSHREQNGSSTRSHEQPVAPSRSSPRLSDRNALLRAESGRDASPGIANPSYPS